MILNPCRAGLALGAAVGSFHLLWSALVAGGVAQQILAFILWLHFIQLTVRIAPFDPGVAAMLVGVTAALGFVGGATFAALWNWIVNARRAAAGGPHITQ